MELVTTPATIYLRHTSQGVVVRGVTDTDTGMDAANDIEEWQRRPMQGEMEWWFDDEKTVRVGLISKVDASWPHRNTPTSRDPPTRPSCCYASGICLSSASMSIIEALLGIYYPAVPRPELARPLSNRLTSSLPAIQTNG